MTPLMAASAAGHVAVVAQLAAWGANAEARDSVGRLPLDVAPEAHRRHGKGAVLIMND